MFSWVSDWIDVFYVYQQKKYIYDICTQIVEVYQIYFYFLNDPGWNLSNSLQPRNLSKALGFSRALMAQSIAQRVEVGGVEKGSVGKFNV